MLLETKQLHLSELAPSALPVTQILIETEKIILGLADYIYAHTPLKPMSKTIFLISRCLLAAKDKTPKTVDELIQLYRKTRQTLNGTAPSDDFDFNTVVQDCKPHMVTILDAVERISKLTKGLDCLGLIFNTLLRGKYESGEGLGTFLTPEEVVIPMVDMLLSIFDPSVFYRGSKDLDLFYGDICGGTGRFVWAINQKLETKGLKKHTLSKQARLFDQSAFAVDMARINFILSGMSPEFECVDDSLTTKEVSAMRGRFALLATNPPFGSAKYRWTPALEEALGKDILKVINLSRAEDRADPSELFFFRNLDLLAMHGALAIVLPDGVLYSARFRNALEIYERLHEIYLDIRAIVSLPVVTFSMGGTVAKTSFIILKKEPFASTKKQLYVATSKNIGFKKKGNQTIRDTSGNDLIDIALEFKKEKKNNDLGQFISDWHSFKNLNPTRLLHQEQGSDVNGVPLSQLAKLIRSFCDLSTQDQFQNTFLSSSSQANVLQSQQSFHVSILDVDETGFINVNQIVENKPVSRVLRCQPGDILLSCLNPKIWRVTVIPNLPGEWSCSPEFVVLRPYPGVDPWGLSLSLHHPDFMEAVQSLASGTSSSRQRVEKEHIGDILVSKVDGETKQLADGRNLIYKMRLSEYNAFKLLHQGNSKFDLSIPS